MEGAEFVPFWKQRDLAVSDPDVRVSYWQKPGSRLVVLTNFTDRDRTAQLRSADANAKVQFAAAWNVERLAAEGREARLIVPAKRAILVTASEMR